MKIIVPSIEVMRNGLEEEMMTPEQFIERVGRTCYKSEDKITPDSAAKFVSGLVKRGHEAMLEHWTYIFEAAPHDYEEIKADWDMLTHCTDVPADERLRPFLRFTDNEEHCVISGNIRAWRDYAKAAITGFGFLPMYMYGVVRCNPLFFPEFQDYVPAIICNDILMPITVKDLVNEEEHNIHHDVTVKFTCDRGVSHEIVRHRNSFAQESTRYCNYSCDQFGNEITVIRPSWCDSDSVHYVAWLESCKDAENGYFKLLKMGATPQQARAVLPNSLKTEVVMTANMQNWDHFFKLRCASDAHPDMQEVANLAADMITEDFLF